MQSRNDNDSHSARAQTFVLDDPLYGIPDESLDRIERVIALTRVVLSVCALAVTLLDPRIPSNLLIQIGGASGLYLAIGLYIIFSATLLWLYTYRRLHSRNTSKPILVADVAWFTVIVALSEGSTSPFFLFYLFAVCTAAIRWGIRTTLRVALYSSFLYLVSILIIRRIHFGPDFPLHPAHWMRPIYLLLIGYLVGFIGEHELSAKRRLIELISMQREVGRSRSQTFTLARLLRRIARFFGADYVLLHLRPIEGPPLAWEGTRGSARRLVVRSISPGGAWSPDLPGPLAYRVSHVLGNWGRRAESYAPGQSRLSSLTDSEEPVFLARSRLRSLISLPIASASGLRGRILIGRARANFSREDLDFCQTLLSQAAMILDNLILQDKAEELAVAEERARIARDVHDGFVQSLASLDVGIEVCRRMASKDPEKLDAELADLQRAVKQGYLEARRYLEQLRNRQPHGPDVAEAVREIVRDYRERGDLEIELYANAEGVPARHGVGFELLQIVREGLTNVHRHARAHKAQVSVDARDSDFLVIIRDDGRGFPAASANGNGDLPANAAPWSIRERVAALGGRLSLKSRTGGGSEIRITLPRPHPT
jgi:signal transduction histidine kinase